MSKKSKLNLVISKEAKKDLIEIADFIEKNNINAAKNVIKLLKNSCETLTLFPNMGKSNSNIKSNDVKIFAVKWKYIIIYKIENNDLVVLKFLSQYQDICNLL